MEKRKPKKKSVGLALGGGGARGLAHIGVIKALEHAGIEISFIAGTSMGALVGGFYAATKDIETLEKLFLNVKEKDMLPVRKLLRTHKKAESPFRDTQPVIEILKSHIEHISIEKCKIPFSAVATDVKNGDTVILKKGPLTTAIQASTALPILFAPVPVGERLLADGGLVDPVPADVVRDMGAEFVVAVDVSREWPDISEDTISIHGIKSLIADVLPALEFQIARHVLDKADIVLHPPVAKYHWADFPEANDIIRLGTAETAYYVKQIRNNAGYPKPVRTPIQKITDFFFDANR